MSRTTLIRSFLQAHALARFLLLALAFAALAPAARAEGIAVTNATIEQADDGWSLDAAFDVQFSQRLEEAVNRGVPLYFIVEFELSKPRWYWFDDKPVRLSQTYRISYTPLLRQYRLSVGSVYQNFTDRKSTRLNSSHSQISYAVFCLKKKTQTQ